MDQNPFEDLPWTIRSSLTRPIIVLTAVYGICYRHVCRTQNSARHLLALELLEAYNSLDFRRMRVSAPPTVPTFNRHLLSCRLPTSTPTSALVYGRKQAPISTSASRSSLAPSSIAVVRYRSSTNVCCGTSSTTTCWNHQHGHPTMMTTSSCRLPEMHGNQAVFDSGIIEFNPTMYGAKLRIFGVGLKRRRARNALRQIKCLRCSKLASSKPKMIRANRSNTTHLSEDYRKLLLSVGGHDRGVTCVLACAEVC